MTFQVVFLPLCVKSVSAISIGAKHSGLVLLIGYSHVAISNYLKKIKQRVFKQNKETTEQIK